VLGAIAAAVQLAVTCYQSEQRLTGISANTRRIETVYTECTSLIGDIENSGKMLGYINEESEERSSVETLCGALRKIKADIEKHKQTGKLNIFKCINVFGNEGMSYQIRLITALQVFQTRIMLRGRSTLDDMRNSLAADRADVPLWATSSIAEIMQGLTMLAGETTVVKQCLKAVEVDTREAEVALRDLKEICAHSLVHAADTRYGMMTIREELKLLKDTQSRLLNAQLVDEALNHRTSITAELLTMDRYLDSIWLDGGDLSDQDIWECFHDIFSSVKAFDFWKNLPLYEVSYRDWVDIVWKNRRPCVNPIAHALMLRILPSNWCF